MSITGPADGPPYKVGVALVDVLTGLHAAVAVTAALHGGEGARIEVPLLDSALAGLVNVAQGALVTGAEPERHGNAHPSIVPYQDLATASGRVAVAAPNDGLFRALCRTLGVEQLADDERFATNADRVRHRAELIPLLEERLAARRGRVGRAPRRRRRAGRQDPHGAGRAGRGGRGRARRHRARRPPDDRRARLVGPPARIPHAREATPPPLLGQHTAEVLHELGRSRAEIEQLAERGVVALGAE